MEFSPDAKRVYQLQPYGATPTIDGVRLIDLRRFHDDGGAMTELGRLVDGRLQALPDFPVRQINYSVMEPGAIKAFHLHSRQTDVWYVPPTDRLLMVLVDVRKGSATEGMLTMLCFGLGTVPAMLSVGTARALVRPAVRARLSLLSGVLVIAFGLMTLLRGFGLAPHVH